jgi:hypothetical protein
MKRISFDNLSNSHLVVDAVYDGGAAGNAGDDPISKLLKGTGNQGGFRTAGSFGNWKWIALYTSGEDADWPDYLDTLSGEFVYYGDNKTAGHELHETPKNGNKVLREIFTRTHSNNRPLQVPPTFIFRKFPNDSSNRSVQFLGLAVPGAKGKTETEDLISIWKSTNGERFQNYRSIFTILDAAVISSDWIDGLRNGIDIAEHAPKAWIEWKERKLYRPLVTMPTKAIRSVSEQTATSEIEIQILETIWRYFQDDYHRFEYFAAWLYALSDDRAVIDEVTRRSVDHGRDAIGHYKLGLNVDPVVVEFALEAKCYNPGFNNSAATTVGVKDVARLISRLKHRQFGVLVTTSQISRQAYEEVREDKHPVILISGVDIARLLISKGYKSALDLSELLKTEFPIA